VGLAACAAINAARAAAENGTVRKSEIKTPEILKYKQMQKKKELTKH